MLDTLEVWMSELPEDGVLGFVPDDGGCFCVPLNTGRFSTAVCEASVGENVATHERSRYFVDDEVLRVNFESPRGDSLRSLSLSDAPLVSHPFGDVLGSSEGCVASDQEEKNQVSHGSIIA